MKHAPALPRDFLFSAVNCGLKKEGPDLALITSKYPAYAAAVFTTNRVQAAPILLCKRHIGNRIAGVVINSKNANAVTGPEGDRNALRTASLLAKKLKVKPGNILVASTGVIGRQLPMRKIEAGIDAAFPLLAPSENNAPKAIMTTDKFEKKAYRQVTIDGTEIRIFAMAKGAGMIHPNMATMLVFITTDAAIVPTVQRRILLDAVNATFNRISVDGDTSTNDMVLMLANGRAGNKPVRSGAAERLLARAVRELCEEIGVLIVKDGEGATKVIKITVKGARDRASATAIARTVATSNLTKTAFYGADANWGRILAAAGRAGVAFNAYRATLTLNGITIYRRGRILTDETEELDLLMKKPMQDVVLDCGLGKGKDSYWFSDLTHEYVTVNADYRT
ncbi:MAG: bifunctional glutamate N-acetyltransferase/amino-acid acetyltransferase ArgJ [Spirochaetota bacterium]